MKIVRQVRKNKTSGVLYVTLDREQFTVGDLVSIEKAKIVKDDGVVNE